MRLAEEKKVSIDTLTLEQLKEIDSRFEEDVIKAGVNGCLSVMREIGMLPKKGKSKKKKNDTYIAQRSYWVRAPHSGSFRSVIKVGTHVTKGDILAEISDPFGENTYKVISYGEGIVIGMSMIPLVNKGDAMVHIATFSDSLKVKALAFEKKRK